MLWQLGAVLIGLAYGAVLQRGRFCFVSGLRDWFLFRSYRILLGIAAGVLVATAGFALLSAAWQAAGQSPTGRLWVLPLGANTVVGGLLFGFGMVMAGGCASGTLYRIGEGYVASLAALAAIVGFFPLGMWVRQHSPWLRPVLPMGQAWLPRWLGLPAAALITLAIAAAFIVLARKKLAASAPPAVADPPLSLKARLLQPISPLAAGVMLAGINIFQTALDRPWGISEPLFWMSASHGDLSGFVQRALVQTRFSPLLLDLGIILGALLAARAAGELAWRRTRPLRLLQALGGGAMMGLGIPLAFGCNVGGVFSGLPSLSLTAWVYLLALMGGVWLAIKALRMA